MTTKDPSIDEVRALERFIAEASDSRLLLTFQGILRSHERMFNALSTPPADDVREALAAVLDDSLLCWTYNGTHTVFHPTKGADAVLARFEVRPRGTVTRPDAGPLGSGHSPSVDTAAWREGSGGSVEEPSTHLIHGPASTPPADYAREATRIDIADEISGIQVGTGYESTTIGIDAALEAADEILAAFEVRPRGTVTDAEVEAAVERIRARLSYASLHWGAEGLHSDALPHIARAALGAKP